MERITGVMCGLASDGCGGIGFSTSRSLPTCFRVAPQIGWNFALTN